MRPGTGYISSILTSTCTLFRQKTVLNPIHVVDSVICEGMLLMTHPDWFADLEKYAVLFASAFLFVRLIFKRFLLKLSPFTISEVLTNSILRFS